MCFVIFLGIAGFSIYEFQSVFTVSNEAAFQYGYTCGIDSNVLDKPKKIFIDQHDCESDNNVDAFSCTAPWICINDCPQENFNINHCNDSDIESFKKKIMCANGVDLKNVKDCITLREYTNENKCVKWYNNVQDKFGICISNGATEDTNLSSEKAVIVEYLKMLKELVAPLVYAIILTIILVTVFIVSLKWSASFIFWTFIIFVGTSIIIGIIWIGIVIGISSNSSTQESDLFS